MTGGAYMHPDEGNTSWMNNPDLPCREHPISVFFPKGKNESRPAGAYQKAQAICAGCPVRQACLEYALRTNQADGVWGGRTPDQRRKQRGAYMKANRTCADCKQLIPNRGPNVQRCEPCAFTHKRQRQYEHARLQRLESPPR
jgi:WhiB family redox-sensing transcriptional regulator